MTSNHCSHSFGTERMINIYRAALDATFLDIMDVIARDHGCTFGLDGLNVKIREMVQNSAEQAILDWAVTSKTMSTQAGPLTNLQQLLHAYCTIADNL